MKMRQNSRTNINDVAKQLNYATSTMYDILHRLEDKKIIEYKSKISFEKIGFPIKTLIIVKTTTAYKDKLREYLQKTPYINNLHIINHKSNFHMECIFRNQRELEEFLEELEENNTLSEIHVYNVLETIYSEKFLTEEEHFAE